MAWMVAVCGARYKTKPGLSYHVSHSHSAKLDECEEATSSSTVFEAAEPVVDGIYLCCVAV